MSFRLKRNRRNGFWEIQKSVLFFFWRSLRSEPATWASEPKIMVFATQKDAEHYYFNTYVPYYLDHVKKYPRKVDHLPEPESFLHN